MSIGGLPRYPIKGQRRKLDGEWIELLQREKVSQFLPDLSLRPWALKKAIDEFNSGSYWQCHETLEKLWLNEEYPLRLFYHGLIKAAVGLLHAERRNRLGASSKLQDVVETLKPFLPRFMGINTDRLLQDMEEYRIAVTDEVGWSKVNLLPLVFIEFQEDP